MKKLLLAILSSMLILSVNTVFADSQNYKITFTNQLANDLNLQTQGQIIKNQQGNLSANNAAIITYVPTPQVGFIITGGQPLNCDIEVTVYDNNDFSMTTHSSWCPITTIDTSNVYDIKITFANGSNSSPGSGISINKQPGSIVQN